MTAYGNGFVERLKQYQEEAGISTFRLASELDVANGTVRRWVSGTSLPDFVNICKLAYFFGVDPNELMGWDEYLERMED